MDSYPSSHKPLLALKKRGRKVYTSPVKPFLWFQKASWDFYDTLSCCTKCPENNFELNIDFSIVLNNYFRVSPKHFLLLPLFHLRLSLKCSWWSRGTVALVLFFGCDKWYSYCTITSNSCSYILLNSCKNPLPSSLIFTMPRGHASALQQYAILYCFSE